MEVFHEEELRASGKIYGAAKRGAKKKSCENMNKPVLKVRLYCLQ